ncbi:MAG: hypothetical protein GMKNLPBB_02174 [Myxococcota bacterium]|nr:hypothetical protein [Myxococcota bacterium]
MNACFQRRVCLLACLIAPPQAAFARDAGEDPHPSAQPRVEILAHHQLEKITISGRRLSIQAHGKSPRAAEVKFRRDGDEVRIVPAGQPEWRAGIITMDLGSGARIRAGKVIRKYAGRLEARAHPQRPGLLLVLTPPLEEYVAGVVPAESPEDAPAALLDAMAIVHRSFAARAMRAPRHAHADLCDLTHCQVFHGGREGDHRGVRAARRTRGRILKERSGGPISAWFHADCGGQLSSAASVWGEEPVEWSRSGADDHPTDEWRWRVDARRLAALLGAPAAVEDLRVSVRDPSGRAKELAWRGGGRSGVVSGVAWLSLVGKSEGWNRLRSALFDIRRDGADWIFTGRGHGHGVGLCQRGARKMALDGAAVEDILTRYFPGARVSRAIPARETFPASVLAQASGGPANVFAHEVSAHAGRVMARFGLESSHLILPEPPPGPRIIGEEWMDRPFKFRVLASRTVEDFIRVTGQGGDVMAVTTRGSVVVNPAVFRLPPARRMAIARHEAVHLVLRAVIPDRIPAWLDEGLGCLEQSDCHRNVQLRDALRRASQSGVRISTLEDLSRGLLAAGTPARAAMLQQASAAVVRRLIHAGGEARLAQLARGLAEGSNFAVAFQQAYGRKTDGLLDCLINIKCAIAAPESPGK